jgi:predicted phosphoadenosine phosphosulfate sulfurtransferase
MRTYNRDINVYQAAKNRLKYIFGEFEYVYVSFSGGKDSSVLLHMAIDYIIENKLDVRLGVFHIDYEAQYNYTTVFVQETFDSLPDFCDKYWCCMPLSVPCATSMSGNNWIPWDESKREIWVRDIPKDCINIDNHEFDFYEYGMEDYQFQKLFGEWMQRKTDKKTACLIGVRSDESYDRRIMIANTTNKRKYKNVLWSTGGVSDNKLQYNFYPIFDWNVEDVWVYHGRFKKPYNKLYDLFYRAGLSVHQMRVASPFISQGIDTLKLYRVIEPNTWGKLVSRVNGVNFSGIYGGTTAMGWKSITKPPGHTWKSYLEFLLKTLPEAVRLNYEKKFKVSEDFWTTRGGVLEDEVIGDLKETNFPVEIKSNSNYNTQKKTVVFKQYPDEINISEFKAVPSYKRMVVCVLKNDHLCKYMGFTMTKEETQRRKNIMKKYKTL